MLYGKQIHKILRKNKNFGGVYPIDRLPTSIVPRPIGYVINLDESYKPGSHCVSVYYDKNGGAFYFDPLGIPPPAIEIFLQRNAKNKWQCNGGRFQGDLSTLCGYYCILFLKYAPDFKNFFAKFKPCQFQFDERSLMKQVKRII